MRKSIPSFLNCLKAVAFAASIGTALVGGAARADSVTERVIAEMNTGKDYSAAVQAAMRAVGSGYSPSLVATAKSAQRQIDEGKDYVDAWAAADKPSPRAFEHRSLYAARESAYWSRSGR